MFNIVFQLRITNILCVYLILRPTRQELTKYKKKYANMCYLLAMPPQRISWIQATSYQGFE